jgi:osmotically-inducible protein OsmY
MIRAAFVVGLILAAAPLVQGCIPVVAGAAGTGALIAEDRRSTGTYLDDQGIELKAGNRVSEKYRDVHVNVTSFNRVVLLTGEAPDAAAKADIGAIVQSVAGVRMVQNEMTIGPASSLSARSNDTYITSKVKTRFIDQGKFQVNHVKVVTEASTVYLMGLVKRAEAKSATEVASTTGGVNRVVQVFEYID